MDADQIRQHLIFLTISGSQSYGLATETSDLDVKGVAIPPGSSLLGMLGQFEQLEKARFVHEHLTPADLEIERKSGKPVESVIYSLQKYMKLAADCNPNIIELLWEDDSDVRFETPCWRTLRDKRDMFLSKKARFTFSGYAASQIKRINTHRKWLLDPPKKRPERTDYNLPDISTPQFDEAEALIRHEVDRWAFHDLELSNEQQYEVRRKISDQLASTLAALKLDVSAAALLGEDSARLAAMNKIGFDANLLDLLFREHKFRTELAHFKQYENWKATRNPARAGLEARHGYDTKHASHVVRLMRMGVEILEQKKVIVKRPDREELLAIRRGGWSYEQLTDYARAMESRMDELYRTSDLQHSPDRNAINDLCVQLTEQWLREH